MEPSRHDGLCAAVGGIASAEDVYQTIRLGASLVQLYTAPVYRGRGVIKQINEGLRQLIERDGARSIAEIVDVDARNNTARKKANTQGLVEESLR